jgi:hypothetical protein
VSDTEVTKRSPAASADRRRVKPAGSRRVDSSSRPSPQPGPPEVTQEQANQRYLAAALDVVRAALLSLVEGADSIEAAPRGSRAGKAAREPSANIARARDELARARDALTGPAPLDILCHGFALSEFERALLLLCAGVEIDSSLADLCAAAQRDVHRPYPTFGLALTALPDAHWSAVTPAAPLRRWRLIELGPGDALVTHRLRIDERVLHFLTGAPAYLDERLRGLIAPLADHVRLQDLPPSHTAIARELLAIATRTASPREPTDAPQDAARGPLPVIQLIGPDAAGKRAITAAVCVELGLAPCALDAADVPAATAEREALARLWEREALLAGGALLVDCEDRLDAPALAGPGADAGPAWPAHAVCSFLEHVHGLVVVCTRQPVRTRRASVRIEVARPRPAEQRVLWRQALGPDTVSSKTTPARAALIDIVSEQFRLDGSEIRSVAASVQARGLASDHRSLWDACRARARAGMDDLAQRIEPTAGWDDLILPALERETLQAIAVHVRQRATVHERWGFSRQGRRTHGLGLTALFAGPSGTGKTLAAEVLAAELGLDLYRIDLSAVVSKYIGETEKNLRRVFDRAEQGGAILLFDEADALFGKRTEVRDSHDRYANLEVSYLLQRMEAYAGLAVLTTNLKDHIDPAFLRRLRFVVDFPFPAAESRAEIWRRVFPSETPTEALRWDRLAQLQIAGGNIWSIALTAAVFAADEGSPVRMAHIERAARAEYAKIGRSLTDAELRGWPRERRGAP